MSNNTQKENKPFKIPTTSVNKDSDEEDRVKIWDGGGSTDDKTPGKTHYPIGHVVLRKDR
jgi:hypothetical protein